MTMNPANPGPPSNYAEADARSVKTMGTVAALAAVLARWRTALIALVALSQAGVLFYMVADREALLADGRVVDLRVVPIDPRDLFRGDYVTLSYGISRLPRAYFTGELRRGDQIYVRLSERQGTWQVESAGRTRAEAGHGAGDEIIVKARIAYAPSFLPVPDTGTISVRYGIEKFFVPEGSGREIENEVRAKDVIAHVAVGADGTAALKGLTVAGRRYDMLPLF